MNISAATLRDSLCTTFCRDVAVVERADDFAVALPLSGRDGDQITAYVKPMGGGWRVSDKGATMMRLSYENDLTKLLTGARERLYSTVLHESGITDDDGELYLDVAADALPRALFTLGQGVTRIEDLGLWTRTRVESSFYEDLQSIIRAEVGEDGVSESYQVPGVPSSAEYLVDFCVKTSGRPLYVFGVLNGDKARLTTIILQHLAKHSPNFESMVVYADIDDIPRADTKRLMSAANDSVASINDRDVIRAKIAHRRVAA